MSFEDRSDVCFMICLLDNLTVATHNPSLRPNWRQQYGQPATSLPGTKREREALRFGHGRNIVRACTLSRISRFVSGAAIEYCGCAMQPIFYGMCPIPEDVLSSSRGDSLP